MSLLGTASPLAKMALVSYIMYAMVYGEFLTVQGYPLLFQKAPFVLSAGISFVVLALAKREAIPARASAVLSLACVCALRAATYSQNAPLVFVGNALIGVAYAHMTKAYLNEVVDKSSRFTIVAACTAISPFARLTTFAIRGAASFFVLLAVLITLIALFGKNPQSARAPSDGAEKSKAGLGFAAFCLQSLFSVAAVFSAAYGSNGAWTFNVEGSLSELGGILACPAASLAAFLLWLCFQKRGTFAFAQAAALAVSLGLVALAVLQPESFIGGFGPSFLHLFAVATFNAVTIVLAKEGLQNVWTLLALRSVNPLIAGTIFVLIPTGFAPGPQTVVTIVMYTLMATLVLFVSKKAGDRPGNTNAKEENTSYGEVADVACRSVAERGGLTPREAQIMSMLAGGRSRPFIEETLFISSGTAKTHIRHIYSKLGIHSKQDLISLVKEEETRIRERQGGAD